ncbi:MAG: hypothetical protein C0428_14700 [Polaromonas sp.]|nr:hypothetical protein [Polaromonas sp.]
MGIDDRVESMDQFRGVLMHFGNMYANKAVCFGANQSLAEVRPVIEAELQRLGSTGLPTPRQILLALTARYPCPLSPYRTELRPAEARDMAGSWLLSGTALQFRFPPQSPAWESEKLVPLQCEAVGYFPDSELRTAEMRGASTRCPFSTAGDLEFLRKNPRVARWSVPAKGQLDVTRTDVDGHLEGWDVFVVDQTFSEGRLTFAVGDLLQYRRKSVGNQLNAAAGFRHLRRLPATAP